VKAELYTYRCWVNESDPNHLRATLDQLLDEVKFEKLGFVQHHFEPQGYTCIWLLGESHLAVHT